MQIISIVGDRNSGKTGTAIQLANELVDQGHRVCVVFNKFIYKNQYLSNELDKGVTTLIRSGREDIIANCDYLIYDDYLHPRTHIKYDLSPIITEETYKRLALSK